MKCGVCMKDIEEDAVKPHGGLCKSCMNTTLIKIKKDVLEQEGEGEGECQ